MNELYLIQQTKEGNTSCFSQLVIAHQKRLYQYLLARCHSQHDAEDILQDTFISAFKYITSYKNQWKFSTWLFTIANRLIHKQKLMYPHTDDTKLKVFSVEQDEITIDANNIWIQIKTLLNESAYDILWFFYVEELSIKEIAQILQRNQSWVKITLYRSKKKLAKNKKMQILSQEFLI